MAEFGQTQAPDEPNASSTSRTPRRASWPLFLTGLAALLVSAWALIGPFSLDPLANVEFRWLFVIVAVAVGAVLVFSPGRRK
ncbi:hypothetical protein ERC79_05370 [Rhodococcus sp. ABRD24]|uniref:hypothetical protein n=1 Tax=Rhodococcus sp. ABRD24 TaxID=2507582 RepID=UPI001040DA2A|nr:hypothetical protein [Rhodococcus sp. ABRD24]QBJ95451.1 hypothetical protein ERC79_05370 [Rhodococcus sp. ABRD24]